MNLIILYHRNRSFTITNKFGIWRTWTTTEEQSCSYFWKNNPWTIFKDFPLENRVKYCVATELLVEFFAFVRELSLELTHLQEAVPLKIALRADGKVAGPWAFSVSNCLTTLLTGDLLMTLFVEKCLSETTWPETTWHLQVILQLRPLHLWTTTWRCPQKSVRPGLTIETHTQISRNI